MYTLFNYFSYKRAWRKLLENHSEWKIIHGHYSTPMPIYIRLAKALGLKTIAHSRTAGNNDRFIERTIKKILEFPIRYRADYLLAVSKKAAKWMFGRRSSKARVMKNAIEADKFVFNPDMRKATREGMAISDKFVLGHVGRFVPEKNHAFLLDVFARIKSPNAVLMIVGDGNGRAIVEEKAREHGIADRIIFTGARSDVNDLMQAMDVFVFPSLFEGLPGVVIEAQAAGLPCIISDAITEEVGITDLVEFLPLNAPAEQWAGRVDSFFGNERRNTAEEIRLAGFNSNEQAKVLLDFYMEIAGGLV